VSEFARPRNCGAVGPQLVKTHLLPSDSIEPPARHRISHSGISTEPGAGRPSESVSMRLVQRGCGRQKRLYRRGSECRPAGYIRSPSSARTQATRRVVKKKNQPLPASGPASSHQVKTDGRRASKFPLSPSFATGQLCVLCLAVMSCIAPHSFRLRQKTSPRTLGPVDVHQRMLPASRALVRLTCVESISRGFSSQSRSPPSRTSAPVVRPFGPLVWCNRGSQLLRHLSWLRSRLLAHSSCLCPCLCLSSTIVNALSSQQKR